MTRHAPLLIIRRVRRLVARAIAPFLIAPFLVFASALAPQHVHEPGSSDDRHHAVVHSHFAPHDHAGHHDDATEIEHDEVGGHVVWLDSAILHQWPQRLAPAATALAISLDILAPVARWSVTAIDESAPPHGPPKLVRSLRGPPSLLV